MGITVNRKHDLKLGQVVHIEVDVERDATRERAGSYALATAQRIRGAMSGAQLGELLAVAEKCPVGKLMTSVKTTISARVERMV